MIKAVIIDDEANAVKLIEFALNEYCKNVTVVGKAYNARTGFNEIILKKPHLVLLGVNMPHMTGIELLELFSNRAFDVIFITAHDEYAEKAFELNAIGYLLKPLNVMELISAVKKVKSKE